MRVSILAVLLSLFACAAAALPDDVSTWTHADIGEFFKEKAGVVVDVALIEKAGVDGHDLFDGLLTKEVFETQLGVSEALKQNKILKALDELDHHMTHAPDSVWEWRAANLRLFEFWLLPLYNSAPGALLYWSRHHDKTEGVLDVLDDPIDECSTWWFWFQLIFIPHYPIYTIVSANPIGGFAGTMVYLQTATNVGVDIASALSLIFGNHEQALIQRLVKEVIGLVLAVLGYYLFWHIIPSWLINLTFYFAIYIAFPSTAILSLVGLGGALMAIATKTKIN